MSSRPIPTTPPDVLAVLLPIVHAAVPTGVGVGRKRTNDNKFVQLRADLQGHVTPISRYCRVGVTVWWLESGRARVDEAFQLSTTVVNALLTTDDRRVLSAEWQSGPADTVDTVSQVEVVYSTVLLEINTGF